MTIPALLPLSEPGTIPADIKDCSDMGHSTNYFVYILVIELRAKQSMKMLREKVHHNSIFE
jgi:hypothetical protein